MNYFYNIEKYIHMFILFLVTMYPQGSFKTIDKLLIENLKISLFFSINIKFIDIKHFQTAFIGGVRQYFSI